MKRTADSKDSAISRLIPAMIISANLLMGGPIVWAQSETNDDTADSENSAGDTRNDDPSSQDTSKSPPPNRGFAPSEEVSPDQEVDFPADI